MPVSFPFAPRLALCTVLVAFALPALAQDAGLTPLRHDLGKRSYEAACASCHYRSEGRAPFGSRGPLAEDSPDELVQYILFGKAPEDDEGGMPAYGPVMTDADLVRIVFWLRSTARPDEPWPDIAASVARLRVSGGRFDD